MKRVRSFFGHGRHLAAVLGLLFGLACSPVFIPLPPPGPPTFSDGTVAPDPEYGVRVWRVSGDPQEKLANGWIHITNLSRSWEIAGVAAADGSYTLYKLPGEVDDNIQLYYVTPQGDESSVACVKLRQGKSSVPCD